MPTACTVGQGGTSCTACSGGQYAPPSGSAPVTPGSCTTCPDDTFANTDFSYCRKCTEGASCSSGTVAATCPAGRFSAFGSGSCSNPGAGSFAPSTKLPKITLSGTGDQLGAYTTSSFRTTWDALGSNKAWVSTSSAGSSCTGTTFSATIAGAIGSCQQAPTGYYSTGGFQTVKACASGTYNPSPTTNSACV